MNISVGLSIHNEEKNIVRLLKSICSQQSKQFPIKEIFVISDASTDRGVTRARTIRDTRIHVLDDKKRKGQASRIQQILHMFTGDIIVFLDGDLLLQSAQTVELLVQHFPKSKRLGLVCGNLKPMPAQTFIEAAINNYVECRAFLEQYFSFGNTAYGAHAFYACSRKFAKTLSIPSGIINPDAFIYFSCEKKGLTHVYEANAICLYRSPQTLTDHMLQASRHVRGGEQLREIFGSRFDEGFAVPLKFLLLLVLLQFFCNPLGYLFLKATNMYWRLTKEFHQYATAQWPAIRSSKRLI